MFIKRDTEFYIFAMTTTRIQNFWNEFLLREKLLEAQIFEFKQEKLVQKIHGHNLNP